MCMRCKIQFADFSSGGPSLYNDLRCRCAFTQVKLHAPHFAWVLMGSKLNVKADNP